MSSYINRKEKLLIKIFCINNAQFISDANDESKNFTLRKNIKKDEIALIIREFMLRIAEDFTIDFVIQVEYNKSKNTISLDKGVNIFKLKNFKAYENFELSERMVKDVYTMGKYIDIENQIELTINKKSSITKEDAPLALKTKKKSTTKRSIEHSLSSNKRGQQTPSTDDKSKSNQSQFSSSSHVSEVKKPQFIITDLNSY